jgi:prepilin-type N-terminal cleavage/methylation domain-containing protein
LSRGGFTLLELVIVLMVLTVVVSMTWPPLMRFAGDQQIREWVVEVRSDLAGARYKAITNGLVYQFRYEPGGQHFAVLPYDRPDSGNSTGESSVSKSKYQKADKPPPATLQKLPVGLTFRHKDGQPTEELSKEFNKLLPASDSESLTRVAWSLPLLFNLDGTSDNATLFVDDRRGNSMEIKLRGLTGAVSVGPLVRGGAKR